MSLSREKIKECINRIGDYDKLARLRHDNSHTQQFVDSNMQMKFAEDSHKNIIQHHTKKLKDHKGYENEYFCK